MITPPGHPAVACGPEARLQHADAERIRPERPGLHHLKASGPLPCVAAESGSMVSRRRLRRRGSAAWSVPSPARSVRLRLLRAASGRARAGRPGGRRWGGQQETRRQDVADSYVIRQPGMTSSLPVNHAPPHDLDARPHTCRPHTPSRESLSRRCANSGGAGGPGGATVFPRPVSVHAVASAARAPDGVATRWR